MDKQKKRFWLSVYTMIGSTIGVGIFSIPYAMLQVGMMSGFFWLIGIAILNVLVLLMYAEVIMYTPGHYRLAGLARRYLGFFASPIVSILGFLYSWGVMVSYIIVGGIFLTSIFGLSEHMFTLQLIFAGCMSFLLLGGLGFVSWIERYLVFVLFILMGVLLIVGIPHMEITEHIISGLGGAWFLPFGSILFAFSAFPAVPEAGAILEKDRLQLRSVILHSSLFITIFYALFALTVLLISGIHTSPESIQGLAEIIGPWFSIVGALMGLLAVMTSYILIGVSSMDGFLYDYKMRYIPAWAITASVPIGVFLLGARDLFHMISLTGAVFGGLIGLSVLWIYSKARIDVCLPKRCLSFPRFVVWVLAGVYFAGIMTVFI